MSDNKTLEGDIMPVADVMPVEEKTPMQIKMDGLRRKRTKALPKTKSNVKIDITKIMDEMGYNPVVTQILIAQNEWEALGQHKPCSVHEMNSSSQWLGNMSIPAIKAVEYKDPDADIEEISVFVPKRGIPAHMVDDDDAADSPRLDSLEEGEDNADR